MTIRYTFTAHDIEAGDHVEVSEVFPTDTTWPAIAYVFYKFLMSRGFVLENEAVGADVKDYVDAKMELEEDEF